MATSYRCRGEDREDLTAKVRDAIFQHQPFFRLQSPGKAGPWRVVGIFACSIFHKLSRSAAFALEALGIIVGNRFPAKESALNDRFRRNQLTSAVGV